MVYVRSTRGRSSKGFILWGANRERDLLVFFFFLKSQHLLLAYYCKVNGRDAFDVYMDLNEGSLLVREKDGASEKEAGEYDCPRHIKFHSFNSDSFVQSVLFFSLHSHPFTMCLLSLWWPLNLFFPTGSIPHFSHSFFCVANEVVFGFS